MGYQEYSEYFNSSYWDKSPQMPEPLTMVLWRVREHLGKDFADKLASATLRTISDNFSEVNGADTRIAFLRTMMLGDSIVENECSKWPKIAEALKFYRIPVEQTPGQADALAQDYVSENCIRAWKD